MSETTKTLIAWCEWKAADCEREVMLAEGVGMPKAAQPFARDAKFFRAIIAALGVGSPQTDDGVNNG